ncbi:hypothetical protein JVU11DRAFT_2395 [Chiua virens]|nr:hypothetical protein JVU11DRAFT_2395 [Chiua virens]
MKEDLSQFVLGSMTEQQLRSIVAKQAKTTERQIVIDIWHRDTIMQGWASWLEKPESPAHLSSISAAPRFSWIARISPSPGLVFPSLLPPSNENHPDFPGHILRLMTPVKQWSPLRRMPTHFRPVFFFSAPTLLKMQNYLQALVIAASLRILTRLPAPTRSSLVSSGPIDPDSFASRVGRFYAPRLLENRAQATPSLSTSRTRSFGRGHKLPLRLLPRPPAYCPRKKKRRCVPPVDRTLRPEDPVFKLLQGRLLTELCKALVKRREGDAARDVRVGAGPVTLRTGRDGERAGKRPRLVLDPEDMDDTRTPPRSAPQILIDVKGFEDLVLSRAAAEVFEQLDNCLVWVEHLWGDVIETGKLKDVGSSPKKSDK